MANSSDFKLKKPLPKPPLLLKDYLLDDLSSCSSNGFKSFPRRQCCTTVRLLLEVDLAKNAQLYKRKELLKTKSKSASSATRSAFQRASGAVMHAVKQLPFTAARSPVSLSKSFSRKFMKRSFWKRTQNKEIKRLKSVGEEEKSKPSDSSPPTAKSTVSVTGSNSYSNSNRKSNSWSDREFTSSSDDLQSFSSNSEISSSVNDEESKRFLPGKKEKKKISEEVGVTAGECFTDTSTASTATSSVESTKKEWVNGEEKQQFSPVSVLDFPCDDEDEVSSPFQRTPLHSKGNNQKLSQKTRRIGNLSHIEPLNLEKRIALSESSKEENDDTKTKIKAIEFLEKMKTIMPSTISFKFNPDKLLADFFQEINKFDNVVLDVARDWIKGQPQELLLGWEIRKNRDAYITDMEKDGKWRDLNGDKNEIVLELEDQIFTDLVNEFFC